MPGDNREMCRLRILVVEDDPLVVRFLRASLKAQDWKALIAMDGAEALETIERELPDLVILDIMLPKIDGFEVCRRVREWSQIPIIMLSVKVDASDKVRCLNLGANDYVTKPFAVDELIARIKSLYRHTKMSKVMTAPTPFTRGDIKIDLAQRKIIVAGKELKLTPTEYGLLHELISNAGKVLTHTHLLSQVWGPQYVGDREFLYVFINRLRAKLEPDPSNPKYITAVHSVGYLFKDTE